MGCKTLLTLWLLRRQCSYAGRSLHGIVFTQCNAKCCWLSDCSEDNAAMLNVHHTGLCSHSGIQNVAKSLIVMKTMQLCWTFITQDCVNTMGCKTLRTLWLLWRQCSYAGRSSHVIVFTQWNAKRCWLSDCAEYNVGMLNVHHQGLCSHSGIQNVAKSLIVMKTMQLCWTFITQDCVHKIWCKTLLTLWLLSRKCSYAWCSSH